jgi:hypothetical protein
MSVSSARHLPSLKAARSGKEIPQLPLEMAQEVKGQLLAISIAEDPTNIESHDGGVFLVGEEVWTDGFHVHIDLDGQSQPLLPPSLMQSSLLNARLDDQISLRARTSSSHQLDQDIARAKTKLDSAPEEGKGWRSLQLERLQELKKAHSGRAPSASSSQGKVTRQWANSLADSRTGLTASVTVRGREVKINFGGMGSQGMVYRQTVRALFERMGWWTPRSYMQADQITKLVRERLDELNRALPPEQHITLSLSGHSMGGGAATFAALKNQVPATVINPLRLGPASRDKIEPDILRRAPELVTEVVVQGDWVADNSHARKPYNQKARLVAGTQPIDGIGKRYLLPMPKLDRLSAYAQQQWPGDTKEKNENWAKNFDRHNMANHCVNILQEDAQAVLEGSVVGGRA